MERANKALHTTPVNVAKIGEYNQLVHVVVDVLIRNPDKVFRFRWSVTNDSW